MGNAPHPGTALFIDPCFRDHKGGGHLCQDRRCGNANLTYFYAARFAVEEINKKGGLLGKPIELIEIDNQSTALGSKAAAEQAVKDGVTAVIGGSRSSHALAMAPVLQAAKIPMISPSATILELTRTGDYIFRACFVDDFQGAVMATFAIRDLKAKTAVVLTNTGNKYSMDLAKMFVQTI